MNDFLPAYEKNFRTTIRYLIRAGRLVRAAKVIGTIFGAALVAVSPWLVSLDPSFGPKLSEVALITGIVLTVSGSLILVFADSTTPELLAENLSLARKAEVDAKAFEFMEEFIDHQLARVSLNSYLREIVEAAVTDGCQSLDDLKSYSDSILGLIVARKRTLFDMADEEWNFAVYRYDDVKKKLICLACKRATAVDDSHNYREWEVGEGHVGLAFSRSNELVFSDATTEELKPIIGAKGVNERSYDQDRYKSLASMPISTDGNFPLGILVSTSDRVGRFKNEAERNDRDWEREDVLREVAAYLAILFKLTDVTSMAGGSNNAQHKSTSVR